MDYLIKSAKIISPGHKNHGKKMDIEISQGKIVKIAAKIENPKARLIQSKDLHVSSGWIDLHAHFQDPGYEYKEDLISGSKAAAAGGFTRVCLSPLCDPLIDSKAQVEYLINKSQKLAIQVLPYACVSKQANGKELAELSDMKMAGAVAFSDDKRSIQNPNLLQRALLYSQAFDGLVMNFPYDEKLSPQGVMNEGPASTQLGLKGMPELAEEIMLNRDLYLTEYTGGKIHFAYLSSPKSMELIKKAKKKGLRVTCDVAAYQLLLDDSLLESFDTRYKTIPPLRSKDSVKALKKAIAEGLIDALCSDHWPEDIENKKREFDYANFGVINLQTAFPAAFTALSEQIAIERIIDLFTTGPAKVLGLENCKFEVGEPANLSLFDPTLKTKIDKDQILSKSKNSPFIGRELKSKVIGIIHKNQVVLNDN